MVKLAYTQDLGSCEETHAGSSPAIRNHAAEWTMRGKNNQPSFVGREHENRLRPHRVSPKASDENETMRELLDLSDE